MERIIEALGLPFLTRTWMEGNLRWLIHVLAGSLMVSLSGTALLLFPSPGLAWLFVVSILATLFLFKFTGLKNGLFMTPTYSLPENDQSIALTFDDGTNSTQIEKILDILAEHEIPATFFFTGLAIDRNPQLAQRAAQMGHTIGNHSYSHRNLRFAGPGRIKAELSRFEASLENAGIAKTRLFRPPHGAKSPLLEIILRRGGYRLVHWNLSAKDWKAEPAEKILNRLNVHTRAGSIVLLHDTPTAVAILPEYIEILKKRGYRIKSLSELD